MQLQEDIYTGFFQFFIKDEQTNLATLSPDLWDEPNYSDRLAVAPGLIAVRTEQEDYTPVTVELEPFEPEDDFADWDYVAEASLEISFDRMVITSRAKDVPTSLFVNLRIGLYRVRIYGAGLDINEEKVQIIAANSDGEPGSREHYRLVVWSAQYAPPKILKRPNSTT